MAPPKSEAKSAIQAQFPPGAEPPGLLTSTSWTEDASTTTSLLESTPPQIVRALAQAEPLIRGLNLVLSLVTWTSESDWYSFFLIVGWWMTCLYGSFIVKFAGNFLPVVCITAYYLFQKTFGICPVGNVADGEASIPNERAATHASLKQTLKDIDTLRSRITLFVTPPGLLLPHLALPDSQSFLLRLCSAWPIWLLITHKILPPPKIMLVVGTSVLCWSAPWARVICVALWRSRTVREVCGFIMGKDFLPETQATPGSGPPSEEVVPVKVMSEVPATTKRRGHQPTTSTVSLNDIFGGLGGGIKVTQTLYQSQRRWLGMGWTTNLFPNERNPWCVLESCF
jgi:Integral peroxisomal membrane peroxin